MKHFYLMTSACKQLQFPVGSGPTLALFLGDLRLQNKFVWGIFRKERLLLGSLEYCYLTFVLLNQDECKQAKTVILNLF